MDHDHFDDLTRSVASGVDTRRAFVRLLAVGALGSVMTRLGLGDVTVEAKKHKQAKRKSHRASHAAAQRRGQHQTERRRKKKRRKKEQPPPHTAP